jgi:hypothetical protein
MLEEPLCCRGRRLSVAITKKNCPFPFTQALRKARTGSTTEGEAAFSRVSGLSVRGYPHVQVLSES